MHTVMIAEDEFLIRIGLNVSVPWEDLGMRVVASVEDGSSAWNSYQSFHPDIILTDIRMPRMDGVELIRRIRENDHHCEIIVITCLEEFDILYQLMQMNISGYLLKATMSQEDILTALKNAKINIESKSISAPADNKSPAVSNKQDRNLLYEFLLHHLDEQRYLLACEENGYPAKFPEFFILVQLDRQPPCTILSSSITTIFKERLSLFGETNEFFYDEFIFIFLFENIQKSKQQLSNFLDELAHYVYDVLNVKIRIAFCRTKSSAEILRAAEDCGKQILINPYFYPNVSTAFQINFPFSSDISNLYDRIVLLREKIILISQLWYSPDKKSLFLSHVQSLCDSIGKNRSQFDHCLLTLAEIYNSFSDRNKASLSDLQSSITESKTASDSLNILENIIFKSPPTIHPTYGNQIIDTIQYIRENAEQDISLPDIASMVCLSPNYYSALFKQTIGYSFSEYVGIVRIEKACDLLYSTTLSTQEISTLCGFSDTTYFSRFFKKKVGVPPHQWRISQ